MLQQQKFAHFDVVNVTRMIANQNYGSLTLAGIVISTALSTNDIQESISCNIDFMFLVTSPKATRHFLKSFTENILNIYILNYSFIFGHDIAHLPLFTAPSIHILQLLYFLLIKITFYYQFFSFLLCTKE